MIADFQVYPHSSAFCFLPNDYYNTSGRRPNNWGLTSVLSLATMGIMNAYNYLYHYLQQVCTVQRGFMREAAAAPATLFTAPAVTPSA